MNFLDDKCMGTGLLLLRKGKAWGRGYCFLNFNIDLSAFYYYRVGLEQNICICNPRLVLDYVNTGCGFLDSKKLKQY